MTVQWLVKTGKGEHHEKNFVSGFPVSDLVGWVYGAACASTRQGRFQCARWED